MSDEVAGFGENNAGTKNKKEALTKKGSARHFLFDCARQTNVALSHD